MRSTLDPIGEKKVLARSFSVAKHGIDVRLEPENKIYIGGLPCYVELEEFAAFVEEHIDPSGEDVWNYVYVPRPPNTSTYFDPRLSRTRHSFAFFEFVLPELEERAVKNLDGKHYGSHRLRCDFYRPRGSSKYGGFRQKYFRFRLGRRRCHYCQGHRRLWSDWHSGVMAGVYGRKDYDDWEMGRLLCMHGCWRMPSDGSRRNRYDSDSDSENWHGGGSLLYPYS